MSANALWLLAALWVQGALALALVWILGRRRLPLIGQGTIAIDEIAVSKHPWPLRAQLASNALDNQFQLPVLLYVAGFAALHLGPTLIEVALAWVFVISRLVHAAIHVTSNHVVRRFSAYVIGYIAIIALWIDLAVRLVALALAGGVHS